MDIRTSQKLIDLVNEYLVLTYREPLLEPLSKSGKYDTFYFLRILQYYSFEVKRASSEYNKAHEEASHAMNLKADKIIFRMKEKGEITETMVNEDLDSVNKIIMDKAYAIYSNIMDDLFYSKIDRYSDSEEINSSHH